ncbi:MAG: porin [Alphaproteobacteria bacterium]|nr:MAG: porin [Alphaproteobacteria bacterium]
MRSRFLQACAFSAFSSLSIPAANAVDIDLYGVVNKSLMVYDDGQNTETTIVDNNNESTRIGVAGEQKLDNGLTASVLLEMEHRSNASSEITQNITAGQSATPPSFTEGLAERIARVGLAGDYGALFIGQQDVATDDATLRDLNAASSVVNANIASFGGNLVFRDSTGTAVTLDGVDMTPNVFALGLNGDLAAADSIRFNSASYGGFNSSASVSQGGDADLTLRYANTYQDFEFDSAIGHTFNNDEDTSGTNELTGVTVGSASVKHSSGLGATVSYVTTHLSNRSAGADNAEAYYAKVGYGWDAYGVAAEYGKYKNPIAVAADHEMDVYGLGAEYNLGQGVTTNALYRNLSADISGQRSIEDINVFTVGMRVKF